VSRLCQDTLVRYRSLQRLRDLSMGYRRSEHRLSTGEEGSDQGGLTLGKASHAARQMAEALESAHDQNVSCFVTSSGGGGGS
jgi:hypothetical protein